MYLQRLRLWLSSVYVSRQAVLTWPANLPPAGQYEFEVVADVDDDVVEANDDDTAETNNAYGYTIASAPDLAVFDLEVLTQNISAGDVVTIKWLDVNYGAMPTYAGWWDYVYVYNRASGAAASVEVFYDPAANGNGPLGPIRIDRTYRQFSTAGRVPRRRYARHLCYGKPECQFAEAVDRVGRRRPIPVRQQQGDRHDPVGSETVCRSQADRLHGARQWQRRKPQSTSAGP